MLPRGFPWTLSLIIPFCYGLNISYTLLSNSFDFEVGPRHNWGKEKVQIVEYFCLHISFSLISAYVLFLILPDFPALALSWELQTHIFSFIMLKSKVLFQHVFPLDVDIKEQCLYACYKPNTKDPQPFFFNWLQDYLLCIYLIPKESLSPKTKRLSWDTYFVPTGNWGLSCQYRKAIQWWRYFGETEEIQAEVPDPTIPHLQNTLWIN